MTTEHDTAGLGCSESGFGPGSNLIALVLSKGREHVDHELVGVWVVGSKERDPRLMRVEMKATLRASRSSLAIIKVVLCFLHSSMAALG